MQYLCRPPSLDAIMELLENSDDDPAVGDSDTERHETPVYITPPVDGDITDEDFGEKEVVTIANLPGPQLRSPAVQEDTRNDSTDAGQIQTGTAAPSKLSKKKIRQWSKDYRPSAAPVQQYPYCPSSADVPRKPCERL